MSVEATGLYILMLGTALMVFGQFALFRRPSLARVYQGDTGCQPHSTDDTQDRSEKKGGDMKNT